MAFAASSHPELCNTHVIYNQLIEKQNQADNMDEETRERIDNLKTIFKCVDVLVEIERDLELFEKQIEGDDESLKSSAKTFTAEFSECKEEIEMQLNKLLF